MHQPGQVGRVRAVVYAALAACTLAGCAGTGGAKSNAPLPGSSFLLSCDSLRASTVFTDSIATLTVEGEQFALRRVRSGSGARYEAPQDPTTWLWNKGDSTTFSIRGRVLGPCPSAPVSDTPYKAHGNEPFWSLEIAGRIATWRTPEGSVTGTMSLPQAIEDGNRYTGTLGTSTVVVTTSNRVCHDGMSDVPFPNVVTVEFPDRSYRGCGGNPISLLQGDEWHVLDIRGHGVIEESRVTMSFGPEGRVGGIGSCNSFSASYTLGGEGVSFGDPVATLKACSDALMKQETEFFTILRAVKRFDVDTAGVLVLATDDGRTIRASRSGPDAGSDREKDRR